MEQKLYEKKGISFSTSVISTIGGSTKFISKIDVFMCSPNGTAQSPCTAQAQGWS
jgi:hypothetical protein